MPTKKAVLFGIDEMRKAVCMFDGMNETFNQSFNPEELMKLARACWAARYDITPDEWSEQQVQLALEGVVPEWDWVDGNLISVYPSSKKTYLAYR